MATALNITGIVSVGGTYTGATTLNSPVHRINHQLGQFSAGYGTGTGQADSRADFGVTAGSFLLAFTIGALGNIGDEFNDAFSVTKVKMLVIKNQSADAAATISGDFLATQLGSLVNLSIHKGGSITVISPVGLTVGSGSNQIEYQRSGGTNCDLRFFMVGST